MIKGFFQADLQEALNHPSHPGQREPAFVLPPLPQIAPMSVSYSSFHMSSQPFGSLVSPNPSSAPHSTNPSPTPSSPSLGDDSEEDEFGKKRPRPNSEQLSVLWKSFNENPMPSSAVRQRLAEQLDMTPRSVQIWFQNRRQWFRTRGYKEMHSSNGPNTVRRSGIQSLNEPIENPKKVSELPSRSKKEGTPKESPMSRKVALRDSIQPYPQPQLQRQQVVKPQEDQQSLSSTEIAASTLLNLRQESPPSKAGDHWRPWL